MIKLKERSQILDKRTYLETKQIKSYIWYADKWQLWKKPWLNEYVVNIGTFTTGSEWYGSADGEGRKDSALQVHLARQPTIIHGIITFNKPGRPRKPM